MFWRKSMKPTPVVSDVVLPTFDQAQFDLTSPLECDMVMKGGITSGIIYPYAILQIATKFRLKSVGGTSAGAIAAAFAAAAEYARLNGRPEGFMVLKRYCDELPERLLSLFQPSPELTPAVNCLKATLTAGSLKLPIGPAILGGVFPLLLGVALLALPSYAFQASLYATILAALLGALIGFGIGLLFWLNATFVKPLGDALKQLPSNNFGICTGLTQPDNTSEGLTNWIHRALQEIAFGDPDHLVPLTFGDLRGTDPDKPIIDLKVVTTNLSMGRPHTLPRLGMAAGFLPQEWNKLFPKEVMDHLYKSATRPWKAYSGAWVFPQEDQLPVLIAVRMSLSFPLLFTAVPVIAKDTELRSIATALGTTPNVMFKKVHFSDGGISSNFPIHMFDAPLPTRPTFAFSLDDLVLDQNTVTTRISLPQTASEGMGVQIKQIDKLADFGWQILNSAKDWQDQLLSEITGQRERIVRVFLTPKEGGLNLNMTPAMSLQLMRWGYEAGCKFTDSIANGGFDFDEHRWRRLLVLYKHMESNLNALDRIWNGGFEQWYADYAPNVKSYDGVGKGDRRKIARNLARLLAAREESNASPIFNRDEKFPKKAGALKVAPKY